jgi:heterodisulfide reductase subunit A-like polyferredoxin
MKKPKFIPEFKDIPAKRQKMPELTHEERNLNFKEVELGFSEEMALAEASRCLSCRRCIGCGLCLAECDQDAIIYDETAQKIEIEADAIVLTSDGETFNPVKKPHLGYCESANVMTSYEFERLVSPTGPFGGLLVRPFDGDIPRRIAFIQCVGSREEAIGANYCSVECCSLTLAQARKARQLVQDAEITVFHRGIRPVGKRGELDFAELGGEDWIDFLEVEVCGISEDAKDGGVRIKYLAGEKEHTTQFDLVVLGVGIQARKEFRRLARAGGRGTNKFGFVEGGIGHLISHAVDTSFAGAVMGPTPASRSIVEAIAAASRSLNGAQAGEAGRTRESTGKVLVYACEYGLELAGKPRSIVDELKPKGWSLEAVHPFLCYRAGRDAIAGCMAGASGLVVVGCHKHGHEELFERISGLGPARVVILGEDDLNDDLEGRVAEAIKVISQGPTGSHDSNRPQQVAIVGAGISGVAAASELARRSMQVTLIEKSDRIGGSLLEAAIREGAEADVVEGFIKAIEADPKVRLLVGSELASVESADGVMTLRVDSKDGTETIEVGALLVATGSGVYEPDEYLSGRNEAVLTQSDFKARVLGGGSDWKRIVMIQCVGARDADHPYCSRYCCRQALENALRYKSENADSEITILHKGIRVFGFEEDLYTDAMEQGIQFVEIEGKPDVEGSGPIVVRYKTTDGHTLSIECDLLALSVAHSHGERQKVLAEKTGVSLDELGFIATAPRPDMPFTTSVDGVFVCGFARAPVIAKDAFIEGTGAAGSICRYLSP